MEEGLLVMGKNIVRELNDQDINNRIEVGFRSHELIKKDICPTCKHLKDKDVFLNQEERIFYEDSYVQVFLEMYPRAIGHTIIITKEHYEDITKMPRDIANIVMSVIQNVSKALKDYYKADKIYIVSMCSGELSHFNVQLIPRLKGDRIGSKVFNQERKVLNKYEGTIEQLRKKMETKEWLNE